MNTKHETHEDCDGRGCCGCGYNGGRQVDIPHDDEDHEYDPYNCERCSEDGPPDTQFHREVYGRGYSE